MLNNVVQAPGEKLIPSPTNETQALSLIRDLCRELNQQRINYCHWKSTEALDRSASGENDLDLLVSRADAQRFSDILFQLDFKQADEYTAYRLPGIVDYYGLDSETGKLVHAHVHYQLVFGHDATKNYRLPLEEPYLSSAYLSGMFKIPSPAFELIILVIRMILKHATWDTLLLRQGKLSGSERNELDYLLPQASMESIQEVLSTHLPYLDEQIFLDCVRVLTTRCSLIKRALVGQRLLNRLKQFSRHNPFIDSSLKFWRRFAWPFEIRILRRDVGKQISDGGLMVAIIGGDGSGKTTAVEEVYQWLSPDISVYRFHMGKPKWSLLTLLLRGLVKIGRSLGFYPFMQAEISYTKDTDKLIFPGYPWLIRETCTARDRYLTYKKALRLATNGKFVILDRFPHELIKFMDGPQGARMTVNIPQTKLLSFLVRLEEDFYKKIALPDLLILLRTDPRIAAIRKTEEDRDDVQARSGEIWDIDWKHTQAYVIDANRSKEDVISEVKKVIWSHL